MSHDIVRPCITKQVLILELVTENENLKTSSTTENVLNVSVEVNVEAYTSHSSLIAGITHCCLQLPKELDLVREYLLQGKDVDVPFTPYPTKKQKKQISKLNSYNTRSKNEPKDG